RPTVEATTASYSILRHERSGIKPFPALFPALRQAGRLLHKKTSLQLVVTARLAMSGRLDSNQRPPEPHSGALAKLRHAPSLPLLSRARGPCQGRGSSSGGSTRPPPKCFARNASAAAKNFRRFSGRAKP